MPETGWINFATDILLLRAGGNDDGMLANPMALFRAQTEPEQILHEHIDRLFSRTLPQAVIYFPTGLYRFTLSVEFPEPMMVLMGSKAVLLPDPEVVLTFRCGVRANLQQIFGRFESQVVKPARPGAVLFRGNRMTELRPEWFGAIGGSEVVATDNSDAFNACIRAAHTDRIDRARERRLFPTGGGVASSGALVPATLMPGVGMPTSTTPPWSTTPSMAPPPIAVLRDDFVPSAWEPPIPIVLSSHYFIQRSLSVGSFAPPGLVQPAPFVMRGEDGVGPGGGSASLQWSLPDSAPGRVLLEILGEIGAVIDNVHFNANELRAQSCVQMIVSTQIDPTLTAVRAPGVISAFRRCTFTGGSKNAFEIKTPVSIDQVRTSIDAGRFLGPIPDYEWPPINRTVFDSCRFLSAEDSAMAAFERDRRDVFLEADGRVLIQITASDEVGIGLVGCGLRLGHRTPNIQALGGSLFVLSCAFHSFIVEHSTTLAVGAGKDLLLKCSRAPLAVPSTLTAINLQSQSRYLMERESSPDAGIGWRGVTLLGVASTDAPPDDPEYRHTPGEIEVLWNSHDPVSLAMLGCIMGGVVRAEGSHGSVLNMAGSFVFTEGLVSVPGGLIEDRNFQSEAFWQPIQHLILRGRI